MSNVSAWPTHPGVKKSMWGMSAVLPRTFESIVPK
jgi:hypothetical protein